MPSITTWTRIEPDIQRSEPSLDLSDGLAAKLADPYWMLGRQWQIGKLTGEDAASPVVARINATGFPYRQSTIGHEGECATPRARRRRRRGGRRAPESGTRPGLGRGNSDGSTRGKPTSIHIYRTGCCRFSRSIPSTPDGDAVLAAQDGHRLVTTLGVTAADEAPSRRTVMKAWAVWYRERRPEAERGVGARTGWNTSSARQSTSRKAR